MLAVSIGWGLVGLPCSEGTRQTARGTRERHEPATHQSDDSGCIHLVSSGLLGGGIYLSEAAV